MINITHLVETLKSDIEITNLQIRNNKFISCEYYGSKFFITLNDEFPYVSPKISVICNDEFYDEKSISSLFDSNWLPIHSTLVSWIIILHSELIMKDS